jgi:hypothetical protein
MAEPKRVASGKVKVGIPLMITGGKKNYDDFHYKYTETGKYKAPPKAGTTTIQLPKDYEAKPIQFKEKIRYILDRNFCPDCDRTDRPRSGGTINSVPITEPFPGLDLKPYDIIISYQCQDCFENALWGRNIALPGDGTLDEYRLKMLRYNRMEANVQSYLRNRLMAGTGFTKIKQDGDRD